MREGLHFKSEGLSFANSEISGQPQAIDLA